MTADGVKILECLNYKSQTIVVPLVNICSISDNLQDKAFDKTLKKSLLSKGMLNPLLICSDKDFKASDIRKFERRQVPEDITQEYRCLIGNNRYSFAKDNGYTHIECLVVSSFDEVKRLHLETQIEPRKM